MDDENDSSGSEVRLSPVGIIITVVGCNIYAMLYTTLLTDKTMVFKTIYRSARAGVNSKGIGINQFNSKSQSGIGAELELKDFE